MYLSNCKVYCERKHLGREKMHSSGYGDYGYFPTCVQINVTKINAVLKLMERYLT